MFQTKNQEYAFYFHLIPMFLLTFFNIVTMNNNKEIYRAKKRFKKAVMAMLSVSYKEKSDVETSSNLPRLTLAESQNLKSAWTLLKILSDLHSVNRDRCDVFIQVTFACISL
jgi:hypothetical protein